MNVESERFRSAPSYYAVASSSPLSELVDERIAAIYELGLDNIQLSPGAGAPPKEQPRFSTGLVDLMRRLQPFSEKPAGVELKNGLHHHARPRLPAPGPVGHTT